MIKIKKPLWKKDIEKEVEQMSLYELKSFYQQAIRDINGDYPTEYGGYRYCILKERILKEIEKGTMKVRR